MGKAPGTIWERLLGKAPGPFRRTMLGPNFYTLFESLVLLRIVIQFSLNCIRHFIIALLDLEEGVAVMMLLRLLINTSMRPKQML